MGKQKSRSKIFIVIDCFTIFYDYNDNYNTYFIV